ncbi:lysylphosphatidylglycerol synthase transmembrane domain-containing protein [Brevibacillus sp. NL20B1]|jgi:hypothetical protein
MMSMGKRLLFFVCKLMLFAAFVGLCVFFLDLKAINRQLLTLLHHPFTLAGMALLYGMAFCLRAFAWKWYVNKDVAFSVFLYAQFYSLFINHVLPVKAGDAVRIGLLAKEKDVQWDESLHSVVVMRSLDLLVLAAYAGIGVFWMGLAYAWTTLFLVAGIGAAGLVVLLRWGMKKPLLKKHVQIVKTAFTGPKGWFICAAIAASWGLEAFVVLGVTNALSIDLSVLKGLWVNSMTIAGQLFHFTPGGLGTYESVMTFSLVTAGVGWQQAYEVALLTHGWKFAFSYLAGLWAWIALPIPWSELRSWISKNRNRGESNG